MEGHKTIENANSLREGGSAVGAEPESLGAVGLAARIAALVAAVGMLLPWLSLPILDVVNSGAELVDQEIPTSYCLWQVADLGVLGDALDAVAPDKLPIAQGAVLAVLGLCLALLVAGLVRSLVGNRSTTLLKVAVAVCVVVAVAWMVAVALVNQEALRQAKDFMADAGNLAGAGVRALLASSGFLPTAVLYALEAIVGFAGGQSLGQAVTSGVSIVGFSCGPVVVAVAGACAFVLLTIEGRQRDR